MAVRGMPLASVCSASKAAAERWAESLAAEVAPYGPGVTILLAGTYSTDLTHDGAPVYRNDGGPYGLQHPKIEKRGRVTPSIALRHMIRIALGQPRFGALRPKR